MTCILISFLVLKGLFLFASYKNPQNIDGKQIHKTGFKDALLVKNGRVV